MFISADFGVIAVILRFAFCVLFQKRDEDAERESHERFGIVG